MNDFNVQVCECSLVILWMTGWKNNEWVVFRILKDEYEGIKNEGIWEWNLIGYEGTEEVFYDIFNKLV